MQNLTYLYARWLILLLLVAATPSLAQNRALNKPATATSTQGGFPAEQAFDGDNATRWGSQYDTSLTTIPRDSNSVYVDLQGTCTLQRISLLWENAYGTDFKLEVSDDAVTWRLLVKVSGNTSLTNTINVTGTGRYVRMHGLKRALDPYGYSLYEFQVFGTFTPLPVTLTAFSASRQPAGVALSWATASELQNAGFEVQRSADGAHFAPLALVAGGGTTPLAHHYTYRDAAPLRATSYYRLKQLDLNGTFAYSPVVAVPAPAALATITGYPNPTTNRTTLEWEAVAGPCRWYLTNSVGQVVHTGLLAAAAGLHSLTLDLQPYAAGSYVLTVEAAGQATQHARLQKAN